MRPRGSGAPASPRVSRTGAFVVWRSANRSTQAHVRKPDRTPRRRLRPAEAARRVVGGRRRGGGAGAARGAPPGRRRAPGRGHRAGRRPGVPGLPPVREYRALALSLFGGPRTGARKRMFESLTERLGDVFDRLKRRGALSEADVAEALREIRVALLEADVALPVVRDFVAAVQERAIGQEVVRSV